MLCAGMLIHLCAGKGCWVCCPDFFFPAPPVICCSCSYPQVTLLDKVEGYRYLTRLIRGGLSGMVENTDVYFPRMLAIPDQVKIGCDNPLNWCVGGFVVSVAV